MKKFLGILAVLALFMSCTKIPSGYTGLKIDLLGDEKGSVTEVPPGLYGDFSVNIEYDKFPNFVQSYAWTEESNKEIGSPNDEAVRFQTVEGMQITADIGVVFAINTDPGTAKRLYLKYRLGVDEIIDMHLRKAVQDSFNRHGSKYTADEIIGEGKSRLIAEVTADVQKQFAPDIQIQALSWLKSPRPPQAVIDALNAKVQATQLAIQKENEVRSSEAEAQKKIAEAKGVADSILLVAEAQAKANKLLETSMTPMLIQMEWVKQWDGKLPTVASGSGVIMDYRQIGK